MCPPSAPLLVAGAQPGRVGSVGRPPDLYIERSVEQGFSLVQTTQHDELPEQPTQRSGPADAPKGKYCINCTVDESE